MNTNKLDFTQNTVSKGLFGVTNRIDGFFGDKKPEKENNGSLITLEYASTVREESVQKTEPDFDIRVRLRQLENKLNFKFNSSKKDEDETLQNSESSETSTVNEPLENTLYRASLGFLKEQEKVWSISLDTGLKIESTLVPFARARGRRSFYFGITELRFVNRVLVEDNAGLFNTTDININRKLSQDFSFTYANKFVWKDTESDLTTVHGPSIFQAIDDKQSLSYNIRTRFNNKPTYAITGHEVYTGYRRDLYKKWIFLELTPGISLLADKDYSRIAFFKAKLQAVFGDF